MLDKTKNPWTLVSTRKIYDNRWINVREDEVIQPDGEQGVYGVVHFKNIAVGVLAIEGEFVYLVGQYRYALERYSWEIPEGGCGKGEEPLSAAQRELEEETGLRAMNWHRLGEAYLSNSVSDELAIWFIATELRQGKHHPEGTEQLEVQRVPFKDAFRMVMTGEISDAISQMAIMQYQLSLQAAD